MKILVIAVTITVSLSITTAVHALSPAAAAGMVLLEATAEGKTAATVNSDTKIENVTVKNTDGGTIRAIQSSGSNSVNEAAVLSIDHSGWSYGKTIEMRSVDVINTGNLSAKQTNGDNSKNGAYVLRIEGGTGLDINNTTTISNSRFENNGVIEATQTSGDGNTNRAGVAIIGGRH